MITKLKRIILTVAAVLALGAPALVPVAVYAAPAPAEPDASAVVDGDESVKCGVNSGAELDLTGGTCDVDASGDTSLNNLIIKVINILSIIVGVVAVIMIIVGGLKYITSGGDSSNVSGAKNTIIYAIIGLIVVALAQFIVRFVLQNTNTLQ